jgi:uncharacterized protein
VHYLVDGHNLIGKLPDLSLSDPDDEQKLIERLHIYAQRTRRPIAVVFDPGSGYAPPRRSPYADVKVSYARAGRSADQLIVNRVRKARAPREITVVTSDRALAGRVAAEGAGVMSSEEFVRLMQPAELTREAEEMEAEARAHVQVSADEVAEWLRIFGKKPK